MIARARSICGWVVGIVGVVGLPAASAAEDAPGWKVATEVAAEAQAPADGDAPTDAERWDPYRGMDESGRIPAVEKPVPHPERWRYIPEGRIMPGNVLQRFLVSTFISPLVFRDADVGVGGGIALIDIDFRQQRRREFAGLFASYTSEGQQNYSFTWRRWLHHVDLPEGGVLQEERSFLRASGGYSKTLTRRFFGLGADTSESDESSYTDELVGLGIGLRRAVPEPGSDWIVEIGARAELHNLSDGAVGGVPATGTAYPLLFGPASKDDLVYLQLGAAWDTRDSQVNPYRGFEIAARIDSALYQSNGDVGAVFGLRGSKIFAVPSLLHSGGDPDEENPPTDSLAFVLETATTAGDLPFFALPSLGGSERLRGYIENRFTDRSAWFFGSEWRFWVIPRGFHVPYTRAVRVERVGLAPFFEIGSVADDWPDLFSSRVRLSYGIGLRIALERAAVFRLDFGFGGDTPVNTIFRFGLSF